VVTEAGEGGGRGPFFARPIESVRKNRFRGGRERTQGAQGSWIKERRQGNPRLGRGAHVGLNGFVKLGKKRDERERMLGVEAAGVRNDLGGNGRCSGRGAGGPQNKGAGHGI